MDLAIDLISHTLSTMLPCLDEHRQQMLTDEPDCESLPIQRSALAFEALVTNGASKVMYFKRSKIVAMLGMLNCGCFRFGHKSHLSNSCSYLLLVNFRSLENILCCKQATRAACIQNFDYFWTKSLSCCPRWARRISSQRS